MLTDEGLTYLARRDWAAVGLTLDRWSAEPLYLNADIYAGTAVQALASHLPHHAGVVDFAAALSSEVARSPDHDLFDLLPTSRSSIGYRYDWTTYVIHPDASLPWNTKDDGVRTCWSSSAVDPAPIRLRLPRSRGGSIISVATRASMPPAGRRTIFTKRTDVAVPAVSSSGRGNTDVYELRPGRRRYRSPLPPAHRRAVCSQSAG